MPGKLTMEIETTEKVGQTKKKLAQLKRKTNQHLLLEVDQVLAPNKLTPDHKPETEPKLLTLDIMVETLDQTFSALKPSHNNNNNNNKIQMSHQ